MKYKSEVLSELIEKNGHATTKIPHYESECENEFINEVRGAYPKLCDYSGEWLNYANNHVNIGKFPTERVVDVTNARFENVVPYGYKSAILKGQTFINIISTISTKNYKYSDYNISFIDKTKRYFIKYESTIPINEIGFIADNNTWNYVVNVNDLTDGYVIIKPNENKEIEKLRIRFNNADSINPSLNVVCIEYQTDMENWDIPYFTGMQSVKMPVLTTTGKNLFDVSKLEGLHENIEMIPNGVRVKNMQIDITRCFANPFKENTRYTFSFNHTQVEGEGREGFRFYYTDGTTSYAIPQSNSSFVGSSSANKTIKSISLSFNNEGKSELTNIQLEEGSTATSYEPFKTNILSTPSDLELRGIGNVQDTLDLLTGEVTERIGEIVLDETLDYQGSSSANGENTMYFQFDLGAYPSSTPISHYFKVSSANLYVSDNDYEAIRITSSGALQLRILKSKLPTTDTDGVKEFFKQNNISIQYQLAQESIKTVDLICLDENNNPTKFKPYEGVLNVVTSSETIPPLLDMEVPVEAINQNLAGFIN